MVSSNDARQNPDTAEDVFQHTEQQKGSGLDAAEPMTALHANNVGDIDRLISIVLGAVLLFLVRRRLYFVLTVTVIGAYLLYRGGTGHCLLYESLGINTTDLDGGKLSDLGVFREETGARSTPKSSGSDGSEEEGSGGSVEEMLRESFPASDPPATW